MKKINFSQIAGLLANFGVVAGIVLLAFELHQNNELMLAQQRFNRLSITTGSATLIAENPELASAIARVNGSTKSLDEVDLTAGELAQVGSYYSRVIDNQQWTYREISEDELPIGRWKLLTVSNGWQNIWKAKFSGLDVDFIQWMEENVINE